jgi:cupin fold WbuC family metalloprotein
VSRLRLLDAGTISATVEASRERQRRRANCNLHHDLADPIQRFLNVFQPDSYVRPHKHEPERFELFLVLSGRAAALIFDGAGVIQEIAVLEPGGSRAVEIAGDTWHTLCALAPDTLLFEVKPGPFRRLEDKDFAPWAPREGTPEAAETLRRWQAGISAAA